MNQALRYEQLEEGARYLASAASCGDERREHLAWANRYARLAMDERHVCVVPAAVVAVREPEFAGS